MKRATAVILLSASTACQGAAGTDLDGRVAVAKCRAGETSVGIPILERKLRANGFTLPKR